MSQEKQKPALSRAERIVPKLRFPEFEGDGDWESEPFNNVYLFKITNSFSRDKLNYQKGNVKNIHYGDIHTKFSSHFDITKEKVPYINSNISIERIDENNYCKEGDLIIADASEDIDDIGKSIEIVNLNNEKLLAGLHTFIARPVHSKIHSGFGGHLFKSNIIRTQIKKEAQGAKVLGISKGRLTNLAICYPDNEKEQQKIADCLSSLDNLITAETEKLTHLKDHKKGLLQQLFPTYGKTKPPYRFPEFEGDGDWEEKKLNEICEVNPSNKNLPKEFVYIDLESVKSKKLLKKNIINLADAPSRAQRLLKNEDVIFQMVRPYQKNNYFFKPNDNLAYVASTGYAQLRAFESKMYLFQYIHNDNFVNLVLNKCTGSNYPAINSSGLSKIRIIIPKDPNEQQKIADCLSSADDLITAQTTKIKTLKKHKKGLMQQLFPNVKV